MRLWMRFSVLHTAHMFVTGADMLTDVVAVGYCCVHAAVKAVQHIEYSTHASDGSSCATM